MSVTVDRLVVEHLQRALENAEGKAEEAEAALSAAVAEHYACDRISQEANMLVAMYQDAMEQLNIPVPASLSGGTDE